MSTSLEKLYRGKKVFVTGHTGFKGSWLSLWLVRLGADVKGYALAPLRPSLYRAIEKKLPVRSVFADIRDKTRLEKEIVKFQPDYVFHLAAQPLVRESYKYPAETFGVNAQGVVCLLQAVRKLRKKCQVIIVTTDKVYENRERDHAYREGDRLGGYDPYSASKACAEIISQSYRQSFFNPEAYAEHGKSVATARSGNVIGGGDYARDRIVPDMIRAFRNNKPLLLRNPGSVRPWQYILDPLYGYLLLGSGMNAGTARHGGAYNFGPDRDNRMTVEELVRIAIQCAGKGSYKKQAGKTGPHEAGLLVLDNSKAAKELGWRPAYDAAEAARRTMDWYGKSVKKGVCPFDLCMEEISSYETRISEKKQ